MEPYFNSIEEEQEYFTRRARRKQRMIREHKRRQRRRRIVRLCACLSVLCIMLLVGISVLGKKTKDIKTEEQAQNKQSVITEENKSYTEPVSADLQEEMVKQEPEIYSFEETEHTKNIYSENVISTHAILIDESTDKIVAWKGAKERISPASMTKVLTVLVAAEHITEEQLEDTFTMTIDITDYSYVNDCSNVGFLVDEKIKVKDLFYGTILPSGGDAAIGLATYVAGSHEAFVELMNEKLQELGLSDTAHFTNCVGLYDKEHYCTLYDMAIIMKAAIKNDLCREVLKTKCYTTAATAEHPEGLTISNWFLRRIEDKDTCGEVLGAKTGFVAESGSCAVSYQESDDGVPYICATAGSSSSWRCIYDHVEIYTSYVPDGNV